MSRFGPDRATLCIALWNNVVCPSLFYGTESLSFCKTTMAELESAQAAFAKSVLGVRQKSSNFGSLRLLGLKPMKLRHYQTKLRFYDRISSPSFPKTRLAHKALMEHISGGWDSSYMRGITEMEEEVKLWKGSGPAERKSILDQWGEDLVSEVLRSSESCRFMPERPTKRWSPYPHVSESTSSGILSSFMLANGHMGNKDTFSAGIRPDVASPEGYIQLCPCCLDIGLSYNNTECHLLDCEPIRRFRESIKIEDNRSIQDYVNEHRNRGFSTPEILRELLGNDGTSSKLSFEKRGESLDQLRSDWRAKWTT